jgi:hypothetical protein
MILINCPFTGCNYSTSETTEGVAIALLNTHILIHSNPPSSATPRRGPKLEQPKIEAGISTEKWNSFVRRWETFREGSGLDSTAAACQLFHCADEALGDIILRAEKDFATKSITDALEITKSFAVVPVARGVLRCKLAAMHQSANKPFCNFATKVCGNMRLQSRVWDMQTGCVLYR